jgi:hypothetical protein
VSGHEHGIQNGLERKGQQLLSTLHKLAGLVGRWLVVEVVLTQMGIRQYCSTSLPQTDQLSILGRGIGQSTC